MAPWIERIERHRLPDRGNTRIEVTNMSRKAPALSKYLGIAGGESQGPFVGFVGLREVERSGLQHACQRQIAFSKRWGERKRLPCIRLRLVKPLANRRSLRVFRGVARIRH